MYEQGVRSTNNAGGVRAAGLGKRYGELWALRGLDLEVPAGTVLGLLGHNGAGKTTALRILTTLAQPTEGAASVAGYDVVRDAARVRACIGVAGQAATVDGLMTARMNLEMVGRLYHLGKAEARARAGELLEQLGLADVADKLVKDFSGGMKRRADLAASLVARPPVLFLDEPTTGLDPHSRNQLWDVLRARVRDGATLVLTTQYLEEADRLADDIVVLDHGTVAAHGTPAQLKADLGGEHFAITLASPDDVPRAHAALAPFLARAGDGAEASAAPFLAGAGGGAEASPTPFLARAGGGAEASPTAATPASTTGRSEGARTIVDEPSRLVVQVRAGTRLVEVVRALDAAGLDARDVHRREVTLDDVFLALTARSANAA